MQSSNATVQTSDRSRIALFDNIKALLIVLVVFGHMMHPVHNDNPVLSGCFDIVYLFHMPMFVLVSGLFAKSTYRDGRLNVDRIISFFVLGVAFQAALLIVNGTALTPIRLLRFSSAPWYLIAMGWWSAATPLLHRLGAKKGLALSLALAVLVGFIELEQGFLAISRTLSFLPWFALGYYLAPDQLLRLKRTRLPWIAVALAVAVASLRLFDPEAYQPFFPLVYGDNPYATPGLDGIIARGFAMLIALVFSIAVLKLVPERRSRLTELGGRTLQIYLLHRLIRAVLTFRTPFYDLPLLAEPVTGTIAIVALTACTVLICNARWLERPINAILRVKWTASLQTGHRKFVDRIKRP